MFPFFKFSNNSKPPNHHQEWVASFITIFTTISFVGVIYIAIIGDIDLKDPVVVSIFTTIISVFTSILTRMYDKYFPSRNSRYYDDREDEGIETVKDDKDDTL